MITLGGVRRVQRAQRGHESADNPAEPAERGSIMVKRRSGEDLGFAGRAVGVKSDGIRRGGASSTSKPDPDTLRAPAECVLLELIRLVEHEMPAVDAARQRYDEAKQRST